MDGPGYGVARCATWGGEILAQLSFPMWCVLMCFCAMTAWFLLCVVRPASKAEPSELGVSVGRIPRWQPLSMWHDDMSAG